MTLKQVNKLKLKRFDKIEIDWIDSSVDNDWISIDDCMDNISVDVNSLGYFIGIVENEHNNCLRYTRSYTDFEVDSIMDIPLCTIIDIKKIK